MQGRVGLVGLVTYRGDILARRRSPIPVLTGLNVEQLHSCDERRYHNPTAILTSNIENTDYYAGDPSVSVSVCLSVCLMLLPQQRFILGLYTGIGYCTEYQ